MTPESQLLLELASLAGEIKDIIDYHKKRLEAEGFDTVKITTNDGRPFFETLLAAVRAAALSGMATLMKS